MADASNPEVNGPATALDARMIVIAIDDNDTAWYEMLIPFVVSLRQTDWRGRLGVIGYSLSDEKRGILAGAGISLHAPAGVGSLPCDRYLAAARIIGGDPTLQALALYDADIWFPGPRLDLFDQMADDASLHAAPDAHFCTFITEPIMAHAAVLTEQCTAGVVQRLGAAVQAGLLLGGRQAWADFGGHVDTCLARVGTDFSAIYGLDTTMLHLWAAEGRVRLIGPEYNFVPKWGLHDRHDLSSGALVLEYAGTPVQALHMIGEGRYRNGWRYLARHCEQALEQGRVFALSGPLSDQCFCAVPPLAESARAFAVLGLDLVGIKVCAGADARLAIGASLLARDGVAISAWGPLEVELAAREALTLDLVATFLDNQPSALRMEVLVNGLLAYSHAPSFPLSLPLGKGDRLSLRSRSLPGQTCQTIWNIATRKRAAS